MKLRFLPADGCMPLQPYATMIVGGPKRYIGRKYSADAKDYVLTGKPYECEDGTREAARCKKFVSRGEAVPFDAETAKACGVPFEAPKAAEPAEAPKKHKKSRGDESASEVTA